MNLCSSGTVLPCSELLWSLLLKFGFMFPIGATTERSKGTPGKEAEQVPEAQAQTRLQTKGRGGAHAIPLSSPVGNSGKAAKRARRTKTPTEGVEDVNVEKSSVKSGRAHINAMRKGDRRSPRIGMKRGQGTAGMQGTGEDAGQERNAKRSKTDGGTKDKGGGAVVTEVSVNPAQAGKVEEECAIPAAVEPVRTRRTGRQRRATRHSDFEVSAPPAKRPLARVSRHKVPEPKEETEDQPEKIVAADSSPAAVKTEEKPEVETVLGGKEVNADAKETKDGEDALPVRKSRRLMEKRAGRGCCPDGSEMLGEDGDKEPAKPAVEAHSPGGHSPHRSPEAQSPPCANDIIVQEVEKENTEMKNTSTLEESGLPSTAQVAAAGMQEVPQVEAIDVQEAPKWKKYTSHRSKGRAPAKVEQLGSTKQQSSKADVEVVALGEGDNEAAADAACDSGQSPLPLSPKDPVEVGLSVLEKSALGKATVLGVSQDAAVANANLFNSEKAREKVAEEASKADPTENGDRGDSPGTSQDALCARDAHAAAKGGRENVKRPEAPVRQGQGSTADLTRSAKAVVVPVPSGRGGERAANLDNLDMNKGLLFNRILPGLGQLGDVGELMSRSELSQELRSMGETGGEDEAKGDSEVSSALAEPGGGDAETPEGDSDPNHLDRKEAGTASWEHMNADTPSQIDEHVRTPDSVPDTACGLVSPSEPAACGQLHVCDNEQRTLQPEIPQLACTRPTEDAALIVSGSVCEHSGQGLDGCEGKGTIKESESRGEAQDGGPVDTPDSRRQEHSGAAEDGCQGMTGDETGSSASPEAAECSSGCQLDGIDIGEAEHSPSRAASCPQSGDAVVTDSPSGRQSPGQNKSPEVTKIEEDGLNAGVGNGSSGQQFNNKQGGCVSMDNAATVVSKKILDAQLVSAAPANGASLKREPALVLCDFRADTSEADDGNPECSPGVVGPKQCVESNKRLVENEGPPSMAPAGMAGDQRNG